MQGRLLAAVDSMILLLLHDSAYWRSSAARFVGDQSIMLPWLNLELALEKQRLRF